MQPVLRTLLVTLLWVMPSLAAASPGAYQALESTRIEGPYSLRSTSRVYVLGGRFRREPLEQSGPDSLVEVYDLARHLGWLLAPRAKEYYRTQLEDGYDGWSTLVRSQKGKPLGMTPLANHRCRLSQVGRFKIWIDSQSGYQLRREVKLTDGSRRIFEYSQFSAGVSPAVFEIPPGYHYRAAPPLQGSVR